MIKALLPAALIMAMAQVALAQEVMECDWQAGARSIVEPWEENSKTYANGAVRVAALDTIEPAVAFAYLLVLSPPYDELGDRQCRVVGERLGSGFAGIDFGSIESGYSPELGLSLSLDVGIYNTDIGVSDMVPLTIWINQSTGEITTALGGD